LEVVYRQWRRVLWRRQVLINCKLINKFLFGQTTYGDIKRRKLGAFLFYKMNSYKKSPKTQVPSISI
jgi:hypothetical protein